MLKAVADKIDAFNKAEGELASLLVIPLLGVVAFEVVMRYVFNAPTIWGFEATTFLYGVHFMLGYAYTELKDGHVKVDVFTNRFSSRVQTVLRLVTHLVIFLPVMLCLTLWSLKFGWTSLMMLEVDSTSWAPPIYPFKLLMGLAFLFLLLQGISNIIRCILELKDQAQN